MSSKAKLTKSNKGHQKKGTAKDFSRVSDGTTASQSQDLFTQKELEDLNVLPNGYLTDCRQPDASVEGILSKAATDALIDSINQTVILGLVTTLNNAVKTAIDEHLAVCFAQLDGKVQEILETVRKEPNQNVAAIPADAGVQPEIGRKDDKIVFRYQDHAGEWIDFKGTAHVFSEVHRAKSYIIVIKAVLEYLYEMQAQVIGGYFLQLNKDVKQKYPAGQLLPDETVTIIMGACLDFSGRTGVHFDKGVVRKHISTVLQQYRKPPK